jgi:hypothetical protein
VTDLYRAYTKNTLVLDEQKRRELLNALSKVSIDVAVNQKSGEIMESTIEANFDDDILDEHVKGAVHVTLSFSDFNAPVTVDMPTSIVTLSELKTEMDNYQKVKDVRVRDHARVATLERLIAHIDAYHIAKGRYPVALRDLLQGHATSTQDISEADLSQVFYASYITSMPLSKLNRCTQNSAQCALYTIGINLDDVTNPLLREDRDIDSDVHGNDNAGCAGEKNVACYDLSSTPKDAAAQSVHVGFSDTPSPVGTSTANATNSAPTIATPPSMGSTTVGR